MACFMFKKYLGKIGEEIALRYYQSLGYRLLGKNFFTRYGELDLIFERNNLYLAVEVKTRTNYKFGAAEECINSRKIEKMTMACFVYNSVADWQLELVVINIKNNKAIIKRYLLNNY